MDINPINHGKTILNFELDCKVKYSSWIGINLYKLKTRVFRKLFKYVPSSRKVYKCFVNLFDLYSPSYVAKEIGYEPSFADLREPRRLYGYFQSYIYTNLVYEELVRTLTLKYETEWFRRQLTRIEQENPIIIHMRRGDYISNPDIGVLSVGYYIDALRHLSENLADRNVWIFSDSPEYVSKEIELTELQDAEIIMPPKESPPNESMILMSHSSDLIISNSTFSWWSAYLSSSTTNVVGPAKWFRNLKDPVDLIPPEWHLAEAKWIDF
jgi:hypothetical protein